MTGRWSLKRILLYSLIGALVLCALLGIYAFVFGRFGETEIKILATTLGVCFYSMTAMACFTALEKRRSNVLALPGLGTCAAGMLVLLGVIWLEGYEDEWSTKLAAILAMFAFSFAQASLLSLAQLERKLAWVSWIAYGSIFWLVIQLSAMIVWEIDDEWLVRAAGVLGILDGCASLTIPILFKLRGGPKPAAVPEAYSRIELTCPRCGQQGKFAIGAIKCPECTLKMHVDVEAMVEVGENPPFQFSLRSLLLVTLIVAMGLSLFASRLKTLHAQQRIVERLREVDAYAGRRGGTIISVTFMSDVHGPISDEHLLMLKSLPHLEQVDFQTKSASITARQVALLEGLPIKSLKVRDSTHLTDDDLAHLVGLTSLETLHLEDRQITDEGLKPLEKLSNLKQLHLTYGPGVTPAGVERLKQALPRTQVFLSAFGPDFPVEVAEEEAASPEVPQ